MPVFYIRDQGHTLTSAVREVLEKECPEEFVSCSLLHPLDQHIVVEAPSESVLRASLLEVRKKIADAITSLSSESVEATRTARAV